MTVITKFAKLASDAGQESGRALILAFRTIAANFALLEPKVTNNVLVAYTLIKGDRLVTSTNAAAQSLTVPPDVFPIGDSIVITAGGAGIVTMVAGAGVTINKLTGKTLALSGIRAVATLRQTAANVWTLSGDLT
jgi:hypothetical protein